MPQFQVFDGHNDLLFRLLNAPDRRAEIWLEGEGRGHLDLPRMRAGGFVGGFFAVYVPSPAQSDAPDFEAMMANPPYDLPLPDLIGVETAAAVALAEVGHLHWMERASHGALRIVRDAKALRETIDAGSIAAILHMEGAEAIGEDLDALHVWHEAGLRSLGPVWSRPTVFGHGVPFRFPGSPDTGPELTKTGLALVKKCDQLSVIVDVSHLNEKGFDDVARISSRPLVATHSNAHALTPSTRNLTDRQLTMIGESGGMVGLNFATVFLRPDGRKAADCGWDPMLRHLDHLIEKVGENGVGFGSDFDGATVPDVMADVAGVPGLCDAMIAHGYGAPLVAKIAAGNWLAFLDRVL